jgi:cytidylate kinase
MVARRLGFLYLDTGAMYRAVALEAKRLGIPMKEKSKLKALCRHLDLHFETKGEETKLFIGEEDISGAIRTPEMDMLSSDISAIEEVREAMTELQRKIGKQDRIVAEGRDMGTVVFPDAVCKFFLTAATDERVRRRYRERMARGEPVTKEAVERDLRKRDQQDTNRAIAPLRPAEDAVIIDTTRLNKEAVVEKILSKMKRHI